MVSRAGVPVPPSPRDWLREDHLVYFLLDAVGEMDLSPIYAHYERSDHGQPPFHPRMMVTLLLYAYPMLLTGGRLGIPMRTRSRAPRVSFRCCVDTRRWSAYIE